MPLGPLVTAVVVLSLVAAVAPEDAMDRDLYDRLCDAQCQAKCMDAGLTPLECKCNISQCNVGNNSNHLVIQSFNVTSVTPTLTEISWSALTYHSLTSTAYVVQFRMANETSWTTSNETGSSFLRPVNLCVATLVRVAAVDSHGSSHFYNITINPVLDDPSIPGPPTNVRPALGNYWEGGYFYSNFLWDIPLGWEPEAIARYHVPSQTGKRCTQSMMPPVPLVNHGKHRNGSGEAQFRVHEASYGCIYYSWIQAESICGVRGERHNIAIDVTDCEDIDGYQCPQEGDLQPGIVPNASVEALMDLNVSLTWEPPAFLGSSGQVDTYLVKWGELLAVPWPEIQSESLQQQRVDGDKTHLLIKLRKYNVSYGFKVLAQAEGSYGDLLPADDYLTRVLSTIFIWKPDIYTQVPETTGSVEPDPETPGSWVSVAVGGAAGGVLVLAAIVGVLMLWRRVWGAKRRPKWTSGSYLSHQLHYNMCDKLDNRLIRNPLYVEKSGPRLDSWEVPLTSLTFLEVLGQGAFGQVVRAKLAINGAQASTKYYSKLSENVPRPIEIIVAVKLLIDGSKTEQQDEFRREMEIMMGLGRHPNVVSMIGCCTLGAPLCLVVEHMAHGDLLHYLRRHRHLIQESEDHCPEEERVTLADLLSFARQIAVGMEFLSSKCFVHRDLATRNVLVGEGKCVKIGDFGLARYVYDDQVYVTKRGGKLPLKWMAPEAIFDLTFTTATDVWSFGVVLFELLTLGGMPYPTINNRDLLKELQDGYRMPRPDNCSPEMYQLMRQCWFATPAERPGFSDLRGKLDQMLEEHARNDYLTLHVDDSNDDYPLAGSASIELSDPEVRRRALSSTLEHRRRCDTELILTPSKLNPDITKANRRPVVLARGPRGATIRRSKSAAADLLRASITSQDPLLGSTASTAEDAEDLNETEL